NHGSQPVTVRRLMSSAMDLPGSFCMTTLNGSWIAEAHKQIVPVGASRVVNESVTGFSSNRHNPGFLLSEPDATEDSGIVYGFNLIYSGNHYSSAQQSFQGLTRVLSGISPDHFAKELAPGETFETPEAVLAFSDRGFSGLSCILHDFVNRCIVPEYWRYKARPVLYNSWEGCMFKFNHARLIGLARSAKKLGCELFVLDDGWFGTRDDDHSGLGDYSINRKKLPFGLEALAKQINELGMEFGLWFEPEAVNPDSDLYRAHPDWAFQEDASPALGRHELLLDLRREDVRDYIVASVGGILDSAPISYVKWDMNRHSTALGCQAHDYILGLYDVLQRIFGPRPQILLESCASGGNRFDLGMMCFSPQVWCSDDTDPIERLEIQGGLSYLYPQSVMGAHVSAAPHAQTLRSTPLSTRANVAFFGILGYELDLKHLLPVEEKEIAAQIEFYKAHRGVFQFGRFFRLPFSGGVAWQVSRGDTALAGVFHTLVHAAPGYERLRLKELIRARRYRVSSRPQALRVGNFGSLVQHIAPVSISPNGQVLRLADHLYSMPDGVQQLTASGAALMAGVALAPRFTGTGYDPNGRMQGDFGSNIYLVEEGSAVLPSSVSVE
ncbi:MAG: alpha-galactosidase, partial [Oscillospiraceae bacterium]|nr:alpha-galactosidase [Oscillospiraceae bacterium]